MKVLFTLSLLLLTIGAIAQVPQIARVSSIGTTTIYTDLKKAISEAQDDDFIYIPGSTFNIDSIIFKKRINIIGTGHYPDSTKASGRTFINGNVYCFGGGSGGSLQGVAFANGTGNVYFGSSCQNFTISKCILTWVGSLTSDFSSNYIGYLNIKECVVTTSLTTGSGNTPFYSINAYNNLINDINQCSNSFFTNCNFWRYGITTAGDNNYYCYKNEFRNCIFTFYTNRSGSSYSGNNRYFNSHFENYPSLTLGGAVLIINSTYDATSGSTFVGGSSPATFDYNFDYHLKSSSAAAGSGTDGTDKGIYGTLYPYNPSPYNPHVYYKQVAPSTNAQGQLQINVKVKAQ